MILRLLRLPLWWYRDAPVHFPYLIKNINLVWEDLLAIRLMVRFLFVPLFHDLTLWGRVLSFSYRLGRITVGIVTLLFIDAILFFFFVLWFILPPYFLYQEPRSILFFLICAVGYAAISRDQNIQKISDFRGSVNFQKIAPDELKNLLRGPKTTMMILTDLLKVPSFCHSLAKAGLSVQTLTQEIKKNESKLQATQDPQKLKELVISKSRELSAENPSLGHLFLVLLDLNKPLKDIISQFDLEGDQVQQAIVWGDEEQKASNPPFIWDKDFKFHTLGGVNRTLEGTVTPSLNSFIRDLTAEAKHGVLPKTAERGDLTNQVALILARAGENNVVLVGEQGSGKTYLAYNLAQKIIEGQAPGPLRFKRVVALDYASLFAGVKTGGEIMDRMKKIIEEIEYSGNIILFLDEFQNLISGGTEKNAVYSSLEPHLSSAKFQVIASISYENYHATLEQNPEFASLFQKVEVPQTTDEETMAILKIQAVGFEKRQEVIISFPALSEALSLSKKYIHDKFLPDKAVSILDEAAVMVASREPSGIVTKEDVAKVISLKSHLPLTKLTAEESKKLLNLENILHQRMIDQEEAVSAVANALRRARAGVREEKRPIASFLFVGPTGVGKTELAKTLAEFYFGSEETTVRLDMSEFQSKESLYSLIGPPLGQKGSELGGRLSEAVRRRPFSLVLLDELEKAHPDILNLFLQVIDEARLTDSAGRTVDFSNTIIIATSNAGTRLIQEELAKGSPMDKINGQVNEFLKSLFKPEFLNRFDGIIVFKPLSRSDVEKIATLMIKKLTDNLTKRGIKVEATPNLLSKLAEMGYDPSLGARPLRRLIQDKVEAKIAREILSQELKRGSSLILNETILS